MHLTVAVTPIPLQWRSLDRASIGALHNDLCLNDFYFTPVVEPTANSCFHEQKSPILRAAKLVSITCTRLWNEILQLRWRYIRIQFELAEVARPFLLRPGNEATPAPPFPTPMDDWVQLHVQLGAGRICSKCTVHASIHSPDYVFIIPFSLVPRPKRGKEKFHCFTCA